MALGAGSRNCLTENARTTSSQPARTQMKIAAAGR
jgi:hypothetical protein